MNFDSFIPADLKNALEKELDIMKQAATTGSMDVGAPTLILILYALID